MKNLLFIIPMVLMLGGCSYTEPNDIAYVVAVGFDKADDKNYNITLQFAKPTQISGGASQEGGKGGDIVENMVVRAPNLYSAINVANNILSKKFSLSHTKLIVFSKEVAKAGLYELIDTMIRSEELRPDVYLAVAKDSSQKYLDSVRPIIEVNPAKYYYLIFEKNDSGGVPKSNLQRYYFEDRTQAQCSVLPLVSTTQTKDSQEGGTSSGGGQEQQSQGQGEQGQQSQNSNEGKPPEENKANEKAKTNTSEFENDVPDFSAGQVALQNTNKAEAMGMAIFCDGRLTSELGGIESEIYNILLGTQKRSFISYATTTFSDPVTLRVDQVRRPKYDISKKEKTVKINLYLESDIYSLPATFSDEDIDKFEQEAENATSKVCEKFITHCRDNLDTDILNFSNVAKRNFWTITAYNNYNFKEKFKDFHITVSTELNIRRAGMKTLPD